MTASDTPQHSVLRRFVHLLSAQWVKDLLQTVFMIVLARTSDSFYGQFMVAFELGFIVLFVGEFGLNQALVTDLGRPYANRGDILARYTLIKGLLVSLGWSGAVCFGILQSYEASLLLMVLILGAGMASEALASSFFVALRVRGRQDQEARIRMVASFTGYGFGLAALLLGAPPWVVASFKLLENAVNLVLAMVVSLTRREFASMRLKRRPLARTWRTAKGGMTFVGIALFSILYNKANIFFLQQTAGPEAVAQYSVTWATVESIAALGANLLLRNVLYPLFVELWHRDKEAFARLARTAVRWLSCAALPVVFVLAMESDRIIVLIYGEQYQDAVWLQRWLAPVVLISFLHNLAAYLMMSQGFQRVLLFIYGAGFALNILLCSVLIPARPLLGTVLAVVLTRLAVGCCTTSFCHRRLGLFRWRELAPVLGAAALGAVGYFASRPLGMRELSELFAVAPFLVLGWRWWRQAIAEKRTALGA